MAHAQRPDFISRRNGRVHLNRQGASVQSTSGNRDMRISGSNAGYIMFRGSVKSSGYPLHLPVPPLHFPSLASPCAITFQLDSTTKLSLHFVYHLRIVIRVATIGVLLINDYKSQWGMHDRKKSSFRECVYTGRFLLLRDYKNLL
jgi:hypothetical protein